MKELQKLMNVNPKFPPKPKDSDSMSLFKGKETKSFPLLNYLYLSLLMSVLMIHPVFGQTPTIEVESVTTICDAGGGILVDILASGFTGEPVVGAQAKILYDPLALSFSSALNFGLSYASASDVSNPNPGEIIFTFADIASPEIPDPVLMTLVFIVNPPFPSGTYPVTIADNDPATPVEFTGPTFNDIPVQTLDGNVTFAFTSPPTVTGDAVICSGESTILTANTVSGNFTFEWSTGETTSTISVNTPGSYSVTIKDDFNCELTSDPFVVSQSPSPTPTITGDLNYCADEAGTTLDAGAGFTDYLWSNGATTQTITAAAGTYSVTVTNASGCEGTSADVVVIENASPLVLVSGDLAYCEGTGGVILDPGPIYNSYLWSPNNETTRTITAVAGTYSVTVTDANGCEGTSADVVVVENPLPTPTIAGDLDYCADEAGTTLDAGAGFSAYLWSNGATSQTITAAAGTYSVTVTDANGCEGTSADVVVVANPLPTPAIAGDLDYCAGEVGTTLDAGAGFASYAWSNGESTQTITADAGTYSVTVTDANGCEGTSANVVVVENPLPTPTIAGDLVYCQGENGTTLDAGAGFSSYLWSTGETSQTITAFSGPYSVTVTDVNGCEGTSPDVMVVENLLPMPIIGGNFDYCEGDPPATLDTDPGFSSYLWSNGETSQSITAVAGTYSVTVADADGCEGTSADVVVVENPLPTPVITGATEYCPGSGGTTLDAGAGYSLYSWSNGSITQTTTVLAGTYSVVVVDVNGCSANSAPVVVTENSTITPVILGELEYCEGTTGSTLDAGAGFSSYLWSNGATDQIITVLAGTYSVTVTDANGCGGTSASVVVVENPLPTVAISGDLDYCADEAGTSLDAGAGFSSYAWSNGATSQTITAAAGTYSVTVTDANACSATSADVVVVENPLPSPSIAGDLDYCADEAGTSLDAGAGYSSYAWSNGATSQTITATAGTYSVTVTDANGCQGTSADVVVVENPLPTPAIAGATEYCPGSGGTTLDAGSGFSTYSWSPGGENTQTITAFAGTYSVTVTDANACSATSADVVVTENSSITPVILGDLSYCEGTSGTTLDAGAGFNSYSWSPNGETTQTITAVAGTYSVTVTDANGCGGTSASVVVVENPLPTVAISGDLDYCADEAGTSLDAGAGFSSYAWSNGATSQTITAAAGTYSVTVTDANACSATSADVVVVENPLPTVAISGDLDYCADEAGTSLDAGAGFSSYAWSNGATSQTITATAGTYSVTVTDANGCSATSADVIVIENALPTVSISGATEYCPGSGGTTLDAGSGFSTYSWSPGGETTQTITALAGTYSVTVTDANACSATSADVVVTENSSITPVILGDLSYCEGTTGTSLDAGAGFNSYSWSPNGETTQTITAVAGTYSVTVTDANGCGGTSASVVVVENPLPTVAISGDLDYCADEAGTSLDAGAGFSSYAWSNGATSQTITAAAGTYSVTVTDVNACSATSADVVVVENSLPTVAISGDLDYCADEAGTSLDAGAGFSSYAWSNGATSQTITATAGTYSVTVTDANGCSATSADVVVSETPLDDPGFTYPATACITGTNPVATVTGLTGGTFSVDNGASIDPVSGELNLATTTAGNSYTITYTSSGDCPASSTQSISIQSAGDASFTYPISICFNSPDNPIATITGDAGGTFSVDNGASINTSTGELDLSSATPGTTYTITYQTSGSCPASSTQQIEVFDVNINIVVAPAASVCNDNGTSDPSDDTFVVTVTADATSSGSSNQYQISDGVSTWGPFTYNSPGTAGPFAADGSTLSPILVIEDVDDPSNCTIPIGSFGPVNSCSTPDPCTINVDVAATASACDDNSTPNDPNDDTFSVTVTASATNPGASNQYQISNGVSTWGPFAYGSQGTAGPFPADGSSATGTLVIEDVDNLSSCTESLGSFGPIASCSNSTGQSVSNFTLVNADDDTDILNIVNGMQIDASLIQGIDVSIRVNTSPNNVGSVVMNLTGPINKSKTENVAPYALHGDNGGNYNGVEFPNGLYTMTATPYTNTGGNGTAGAPLTINFSVVDVVTPDLTPPVITLLGDNPLELNIGQTYSEPGATANDNVDGDITTNIVIDASAVNINIAGTYPVTYNVADAAGNDAIEVIRSVIVMADVTPPVITLIGLNPQEIDLGQPYAELGATANDNVDGDITVNIVIDASAVNTAVAGTYSVTYNVMDAAGNPAVEVVRSVIVAADVTPPVITLIGANPLNLNLGDSYSELGATANDNVDGDISTNIVIDASAVNTAVVGTYPVTYNVTDAAGNPAIEVIRSVVVSDLPVAICFIETGGELSIEAENYSAMISGSGNAANSNWDIYTDPNASAGSAIRANPNTGVLTGTNTNGPRVDYDVVFSAPGTYRLWVRMSAANGSDNSVHAGINGTAVTTSAGKGISTGTNGNFNWEDEYGNNNVDIVVPSAGKHTINIWMREDGVMVDKLLLQSTPSTPTGTGPSQSQTGDCNNPGNIVNQPPIADFEARPSFGVAPLFVDFDASASFDPDGVIVSYAWDFGDGNTGTGVNPTNTYTNVGIYSASLTVTDDSGATDVFVVSINAQGASQCFTEAGGEVSIEAENYSATSTGTGNASNSAWSLINDANASIGLAMMANPNSGVGTGGNTNGPRLDYDIVFNSVGTYRLWVRMRGDAKSDNSIHAGLDGNLITNNNKGMSVSPSTYNWEDESNGNFVEVVISTPGKHTVNIWMREDGVVVDKLLLQLNPSTPVGTGPAQSPTQSCAASNLSNRSLSSMIEELEVSVYPNPTKGNVVISVDNAQSDAPVQVSIWNMTGQEIYKADDLPLTSRIELDGKLTNGVYLVIVKVGSQSKRVYLLKQ